MAARAGIMCVKNHAAIESCVKDLLKDKIYNVVLEQDERKT